MSTAGNRFKAFVMAVSITAILDQLEPISRLSARRKLELAALCFVEKVNNDMDPLRMNVAKSAQALYLLNGHFWLAAVK